MYGHGSDGHTTVLSAEETILLLAHASPATGYTRADSRASSPSLFDDRHRLPPTGVQYSLVDTLPAMIVARCRSARTGI